jgi:hypothetical protein
MQEYSMPEMIWPREYVRSRMSLPARMLASFTRWVVLGSMTADSETELSRLTGGKA